MLEYSELMAFKAVAKHLNFSKAAREIGLSAPQVTKIISHLESKIQTKLIERTTRSVRLTQEGLIFLQSSNKTLESLMETSHLFDSSKDPSQLNGIVRITAPISLGIRFLTKALVLYNRMHPNVQVQVLLNDHYIDFIDDEIDLALRVITPQDSSLVARKLTANNISFYTTPQYLETHTPPKTIFDLKNHRVLCITPHLNYKFSKSKLSLLQLISTPPILCTNGDLLFEMCQLGGGILIRSDWAVEREVRAGTLIPIPLDDQLESTTGIYLVYPRHKHTSQRVKSLITTITKSFTSTD